MINFFDDTNEMLLQAIREIVAEQTRSMRGDTNIADRVKVLETLTATLEGLTAALEVNKADKDGEYEDLRAGNLISKVGITEKVPYLFRTAGGAADIADRESDTIVGGTVAWNQLIKLISSTDWVFNNTIEASMFSDGVATFQATQQYGGISTKSDSHTSIVKDHIYFMGFQFKPSTANTAIRFNITISGANLNHKSPTNIAGIWNDSYAILKSGATSSTAPFYIQDYRESDWDEIQVRNAMSFDLTQMFGSTIADYINTLETGTAGAGVAFVKKFLPDEYYAYNEGTLLPVKTSAKLTTGLNQLDPETWKAQLLGGYEYQITGTYTAIAYSTGETLTPDASGKFTPSSDGILTVTGAEGDVCVHLVWDGEYDGVYEPYALNTYPLQALELYGIPKLDASNNLYYDGDEYAADGTVTRKYGIVDLGTLDWTYMMDITKGFYTSPIFPTSLQTSINLLCPKYVSVDGENIYNGTANDKTIGVSSNGRLRLKDTEYTDATLLQNSLNGVLLVYELAAPTTEEADAFADPQICHNFGTEEYIDTRPIPLPVGHSTIYRMDPLAKLESAPNMPDGDGDYLLHQSSGINTYIKYVKELPTLPTEDGSYVLKCTVSSGTKTLTWVAET